MKNLSKEEIKKAKAINLFPDPKLPPTQQDFRETFQWRIFRIMAEFVEGFHFIADFKKTITIFGSTSFSPDNPYYKEARKLGKLLAEAGYGVITGGGPGIMEAANRGAFEAGGESIGINIELPDGQRMNSYVNKPIGFHHFFTRKVMLSFASKAYVFFPGGFGTLDEFFEMVTLIQTKKLAKPVPIVVIGKEFWQPMFDWIEQEVYGKQKAIEKEDLEIFHLVDSIEEGFEIIKKC
ncbi:TIGR00730 family Rossman fold protein [Patescibacteria group bacterium]|nr:TIGR00730 family Rossman fold protein [Patescibacteria group bacterium]MBU4023257.1 TIGR00730 family Rossman fold protein [Patescibacteria group bacterium]MBU4078065.1 TIGR00730 family Rossman fold protein [Patescibacteria group bacterium]